MAAIHDREVARLERMLAARQTSLDNVDKDIARLKRTRRDAVDEAARKLADARARRKTAEEVAASQAAKRAEAAGVKAVA